MFVFRTLYIVVLLYRRKSTVPIGNFTERPDKAFPATFRHLGRLEQCPFSKRICVGLRPESKVQECT